MGENGGADIPPVHDDAPPFGKGMETAVHILTDKGNGADRTHVGGYLQGADFGLDASLSQKQAGEAFGAAEMEVQQVDGPLQAGLVNASVLSDKAFFQTVEGDAPVHGSAVQIQETELGGHHFGKGALTCGGVAVNGYDDVGNTIHGFCVVKITKLGKIHDICINYIAMKILIVDDERAIRYSLKEILEMEGYTVETAENGLEGLEKARKEKYDAIFCDIKMPQMDGTEMLSKLVEEGIETPVIMVSGHADISTAVDCIKRGAFDFIEKPLDLNRILITLKNATDKASLVKETKILLRQGDGGGIPAHRPSERHDSESGSHAGQRPYHRPQRLRKGTGGPEHLPAFSPLHDALRGGELRRHSLRAHRQRALDHKGKFEQADGGTIFLDEIGDMSLAAQAKVLRVLQERKLTPVGGDKEITVDVRVIAATNKDLKEEIAKGNFREDLYHRLSVIVLKVPALDERKEDIPLLIEHFSKQISSENGKPVREFEPAAITLLKERSWPGNIRELRNVVERLLILGGSPVTAQDVKDYAF